MHRFYMQTLYNENDVKTALLLNKFSHTNKYPPFDKKMNEIISHIVRLATLQS